MKKQLTGYTKAATISALLAGGLGGGLVAQLTSGSGNAAVAQAAPTPAPLEAPAPGAVVDSNIFVNLAKRTVPGVVNISTAQRIRTNPYIMGRGGANDPFRHLFEDFFGRQFQANPGGPNGMMPPGDEDGDEPATPRSSRPQGSKTFASRPLALGTGFVIDSSGIILTNAHVVQGADEIKVQFTEDSDEKPTDGKVIGRDPELDIALIQVHAKRKLEALPLGDSDALQVGEYVMAVGNPFGQGHSASHGIVSAKGRNNPASPLGSYLQTDAPINPGNSGGPLVNLKGEVIGINTAIDARAQGIGFAIPSNLVKSVLPQLRSKGSVSRGYIGALIEPLRPEVAEKIGAPKDLEAPLIASVKPGEPAARAGIEAYDIVTKVGGKTVHNPNELVSAIALTGVGQKVPVTVLRGGKELSLSVLVAARPGEIRKVGMRSDDSGEYHDPGEDQGASTQAGMRLENLTPETARELGVSASNRGVVVAEVAPGSPAARSGLNRGDIIVEVDRKPVSDVAAFQKLTASGHRSYLVRVQRSGPGGEDVFSVVVLDMGK